MGDDITNQNAVDLSHKQTFAARPRIFGTSIPDKKLEGSKYCLTEQRAVVIYIYKLIFKASSPFVSLNDVYIQLLTFGIFK